LRKRIVGRLLIGTQFAHLTGLFDRGITWYAKWRWGTVTKVLNGMLKFENVLPRIWNTERFTRGTVEDGEGLDENDTRELNVTELESGINSLSFWGYCRMLG
jgi:hypothetical protein